MLIINQINNIVKANLTKILNKINNLIEINSTIEKCIAVADQKIFNKTNKIESRSVSIVVEYSRSHQLLTKLNSII